MTNNDSDFETIAAFIDSERVDPLALKRALASEEGRNYLVQLVAMREVMATPPLPTAIAIAPPRSTSWRGLVTCSVFFGPAET